MEDNPGFVRGCIDAESRGHAPAMAFSHYATEKFKKRIEEQMAAEKENDRPSDDANNDDDWTIEEEEEEE